MISHFVLQWLGEGVRLGLASASGRGFEGSQYGLVAGWMRHADGMIPFRTIVVDKNPLFAGCYMLRVIHMLSHYTFAHLPFSCESDCAYLVLYYNSMKLA